MLRPTLLLAFSLFFTSIQLPGQDAYAADRQALLQILDEIQSGLNALNIDKVMSQMDEACLVTWWNAEQSRGKDQIRAYYQRMMKGEARTLDRMTVQARISGPALFLGDGSVAVAHGVSDDEFFPAARGPFKLNSKWSATAVKRDGQWKVSSLHLSANVFTNSLLSEALGALWYVGGGALFLGIVLAWFLRGYVLGR